jgi:hypothetical protein
MQSLALSRPRRLIVWLLFAAAGVFFSQSDLAHTVFSSYAILQGHILDFYDFNAKILVGNDYQILVYSVVALWMSPMHILGLATSQADYSGLGLNLAELVWAKAGLSALLIVCANFLEKIVKKLSE